ncbi:unnamed protein product, partial [Amoebophrya sp. A120]
GVVVDRSDSLFPTDDSSTAFLVRVLSNEGEREDYFDGQHDQELHVPFPGEGARTIREISGELRLPASRSRPTSATSKYSTVTQLDARPCSSPSVTSAFTEVREDMQRELLHHKRATVDALPALFSLPRNTDLPGLKLGSGNTNSNNS